MLSAIYPTTYRKPHRRKETALICLHLFPLVIFIEKRTMGIMKTRFARISDKRLHRIVKESVDKVVNEAENGG